MPFYSPASTNVDTSAMATPSDHSLAAWTSDPAYLQAGILAVGGGTLQVARIRIANASSLLVNPGSVTNIIFFLTAGGVTLTSGRNFAGLYDDSGNLLASTADQASNWATGGVKTMALSSPQPVTPWSWYKVAWYNTGLTAPSLARGSNIDAQSLNAGLSGMTLRWATANTGLTTALPSTIGTMTASQVAWWCALS